MNLGTYEDIETLVSGHWYGMSSTCQPSQGQLALQACPGNEAQQGPLYYVVMAGMAEAGRRASPRSPPGTVESWGSSLAPSNGSSMTVPPTTCSSSG